MRSVAVVQDAGDELREVEGNRIAARRAPIAISAESVKNRGGQVRRDVCPHLQIVAEKDFLAAGPKPCLRIVEDAVDLTKAVDQAERVALVSGNGRPNVMARLLAMIEVGVKPDIGAEMQIAAQRITLLIELVGAGPRRRRQCRERSRSSG